MDLNKYKDWLLGLLGIIGGFLFFRLKSSQKAVAKAENELGKQTYNAEIKVETEKYEETRKSADDLVTDYKSARAKYNNSNGSSE